MYEWFIIIFVILVAILVLLIFFYTKYQQNTNQNNCITIDDYKTVETHHTVEPCDKINLFVEYYLCKSVERQNEIDFVLKNNYNQKAIDHLYIIVHNDDEYIRVSSLIVIDKKRASIILIDNPRPTYGEIFSLIDSYLTRDDEINILCNSDIAFDETINYCRKLRVTEALALTRWNVEKEIYDHILLNGSLQSEPKWTQDTWIVKGRPHSALKKISFSTGLLRCDNKIAYILAKECGYTVFNPCKSIKTYHIHKSGIRNYKEIDVSRLHPSKYTEYGVVEGIGAFVPGIVWP
jgi:hypothetical protein